MASNLQRCFCFLGDRSRVGAMIEFRRGAESSKEPMAMQRREKAMVYMVGT